MFTTRWLTLACIVFGFSCRDLQADDTLGSQMAQAAQKFLSSLSNDQRLKVCFPFEDPERFRFAFVPLEDNQHRSTRKGLPLSDMTDAQRQAALDLVRLAVSPSGFQQVQMVFELEAMLDQFEKPKRFTRNPGWYFVSVFGEPGNKGTWGWRIDGHHLSLNLTLRHGAILSATPAFFGANPAEIQIGDKKGYRTLADAEDPALALFVALDENQRRRAFQPKHFPEPTQFVPAEKVTEPIGLAVADMTSAQKTLLEKLIRNYLQRLAPPIAEQEWQQIVASGFDRVHFAFSGGTKQGESRTYRVQGPHFVIIFLNTQTDVHGNPANHIHSIYRTLPRDFGLELLERNPGSSPN